jgi:hypothetical protein
MESYICKTCGVQAAASEREPATCKICDDERQYVGLDGQQWTTMEEMRAAGYSNEIRDEEPGLTGISTTPRFAIGQRALLVQTAEGNILYDCLSYLDDETIEAVRALGGIQGICFSHPHFYDSMIEWSHAFDHAPVYVPEADRQWVTRPDPVIEYWDGEPRELVPGVTLIQTGGHFDGSAVLHWRDGAEGQGALCVGDSITVVPDRRYVSFMYSYPNLIPLDASAVQQIVESVEPYEFDRIYGGWWERNVMSGAAESIRNSRDRYLRRIGAT